MANTAQTDLGKDLVVKISEREENKNKDMTVSPTASTSH